jgi:hypothetical protein
MARLTLPAIEKALLPTDSKRSTLTKIYISIPSVVIQEYVLI